MIPGSCAPSSSFTIPTGYGAHSEKLLGAMWITVYVSSFPCLGSSFHSKFLEKQLGHMGLGGKITLLHLLHLAAISFLSLTDL